jgi:hypothetical protein
MNDNDYIRIGVVVVVVVVVAVVVAMRELVFNQTDLLAILSRVF